MVCSIVRPAAFLAFVLLHSSAGVAGEESDLGNAVLRMMSHVRTNATIEGISEVQLKTADPDRLLALLAPYEKDPEWTVRRIAYLYGVRLAEAQPLPRIRQEVANRLVDALVEPNSSVNPHPYLWLRSFKAQDFSETAKSVLRQNLAKDPPNRSVIRICGVANIQEELPRLKELLIDEMQFQAKYGRRGEGKWYYTIGWRARLARARLGVQEDIRECIRLVRTEEDLHVRVTELLDDIGYIRQPAAIEYIREYLESDARLSPVKETAPGQLVSNYVMSILAESLNNYPVKRKEARNYTQQEIDLCRKWMRQQTKWEITR